MDHQYSNKDRKKMRYIGALYSINNIMSSEIEKGRVVKNRFSIKRERSKSPIWNRTTKVNYALRPTKAINNREYSNK